MAEIQSMRITAFLRVAFESSLTGKAILAFRGCKANMASPVWVAGPEHMLSKPPPFCPCSPWDHCP